jgi:hypothetical protein
VGEMDVDMLLDPGIMNASTTGGLDAALKG